MALKRIRLGEREFAISYTQRRNAADKWAVFLHGWGANKELMENCFGAYFGDYNHLYVDLPGFGGSSNSYVLDSAQYGEILRTFFETLHIAPHIIIGHSFGGKIATLLNPPKLILLSTAGIPKQKSVVVRLKIAFAKICKFLGIPSTILRTKDAANLPQNMYETLKNVVDEDFSGIFGKFSNEAVIFWGKNDNITPLYMAHRIHSLIVESRLYCLEGEHYFFLNNAKYIDRIVNGVE